MSEIRKESEAEICRRMPVLRQSRGQKQLEEAGHKSLVPPEAHGACFYDGSSDLEAGRQAGVQEVRGVEAKRMLTE